MSNASVRLERDGSDVIVRIDGQSASRVLIAVDSGLGTFIPAWVIRAGATSEIPLELMNSLLLTHSPQAPEISGRSQRQSCAPALKTPTSPRACEAAPCPQRQGAAHPRATGLL